MWGRIHGSVEGCFSQFSLGITVQIKWNCNSNWIELVHWNPFFFQTALFFFSSFSRMGRSLLVKKCCWSAVAFIKRNNKGVYSGFAVELHSLKPTHNCENALYFSNRGKSVESSSKSPAKFQSGRLWFCIIRARQIPLHAFIFLFVKYTISWVNTLVIFCQCVLLMEHFKCVSMCPVRLTMWAAFPTSCDAGIQTAELFLCEVCTFLYFMSWSTIH